MPMDLRHHEVDRSAVKHLLERYRLREEATKTREKETKNVEKRNDEVLQALNEALIPIARKHNIGIDLKIKDGYTAVETKLCKNNPRTESIDMTISISYRNMGKICHDTESVKGFIRKVDRDLRWIVINNKKLATLNSAGRVVPRLETRNKYYQWK